MEGVQSADQCSQSWRRGDSSSENQASDITQQDSSTRNDLHAKEVLELIDKLVSSPDSDTLAKQYLESSKVKHAINLVRDKGELAELVEVLRLMKNADVLAAIIRVCGSASNRLFRLLSTDLGGTSVLDEFVFRCKGTRLAGILLEIKEKVTPDHWVILVSQQKSLGKTIIEVVLSEPWDVIEQCARNGIFDGYELVFHLKQYKEDPENNRLVSFEGLINRLLTTADNEGQSEQETSHVRTLRSSKSGREAADLFKDIWDGQIVLMLVEDAAMLRAVLSSINDEQERYGLLMTHYKVDDLYRNIDTPAFLQLLAKAKKKQHGHMLRAIFEAITSKDLRAELMTAIDRKGETFLHKLIKGCDPYIVESCFRVISEETDCIKQILLQSDFAGRSPLELLLLECKRCSFQPQHITSVETALRLGEIDTLNFLQTAYHGEQRCLEPKFFTSACGKKLFTALKPDERVQLLCDANEEGSTLLHHLNAGDLEVVMEHIESAHEKYKLLTTTDGNLNTCLHTDKMMHSLDNLDRLDRLLGDREKMRELLKMQNDRGETLFHRKSKMSFTKLHEFIKKRPTDLEVSEFLEIKDLQTQTALDVGIEQISNTNQQDMVLPLLGELEGITRILSCQQQNGPTTAHLICQKKPELMALVLNKVPNTDIPLLLKLQNEEEDTPLHVLARANLKVIPDVLMKLPENRLAEVLKCVNRNGETVFHIVASKMVGVGLVKKILEKLQNVEEKCDAVSCTERNHGCAFFLLSIKSKLKATALHIASALNNRAVLADIVGALGGKKTLELLYLKAIDFDDEQFHIATPTEDKTLKNILEKFDSPSRAAIESVISCGNGRPVNPKLRSLVEQIERDETDHRIMEKRYAHGDTILHSLARRSDYKNLEYLLGQMTPSERSRWLDVPNFALKKPHDVARSFETRQLMEFASAKQDEYFMPIPPQVLIMYSSLDRDGADQEAKNLEAAFLKIVGRKAVTLKKDLSKDEMLKQIDKVALADPAPSAMFVVVIAHGKDGNVMVGKDQKGKERLKIQDILDRMCEVKEDHTKLLLKKLAEAKTAVEEKKDTQGLFDEMKTLVSVKKDRLEGKPKVLLLQACQTGTDQHNPVIDRQEPGFSVMRRDVIALSGSVRGEPAKRNTMIPIFAEELRNPEHSGEIYEMFLRTNYRFTLMNKPQIPIVHSTLTQKLFLKSPLWKDFQTEVNTEQNNADE